MAMTAFIGSRGESRYGYSYHRTEQAAWDALEDMFACGDVCEGERPEIVSRRVSGGHDKRRLWWITLPCG